MKKELQIYIHIPFCVQKCNYCDFLSVPADNTVQEGYMQSLCMEICEKSRLYKEYLITTVFIGGGTPTCVKADWIKKVMECIRGNYFLAENAEISMEMNPGTVSRESLELYYAAGINRLSIGLQSAKHVELKTLGRIHSYEQFLEAYFTAREIGFCNINVDVMSGLPGQSYKSYLETLQKVTDLNPAPEHISAYSLIIEEGTPFYREYEKGRLDLPDEDTEREMYEGTRIFLQKKGYYRYEISNYAKRGMECRHNIGYWRRSNYIGFGVGAASLIENVRFQNAENIQNYIRNPMEQMKDRESLSLKERIEETMFLGLRMTEGISYSTFHRTFGFSPEEVYGEIIRKHVQAGLLSVYHTSNNTLNTDTVQGIEQDMEKYVCLTLRGMDISNYVMADFLDPVIQNV